MEKFFPPRSAFYILNNLQVWGGYAEGCRGIFLRSTGKGRSLLESLSYQKFSYAVGKGCASVEQRRSQVINVLPSPALGKSWTVAGDL